MRHIERVSMTAAGSDSLLFYETLQKILLALGLALTVCGTVIGMLNSAGTDAKASSGSNVAP